MCKKNSGKNSFESANKLLIENKVFVGVTEFFDESLILLKNFLAEKMYQRTLILTMKK